MLWRGLAVVSMLALTLVGETSRQVAAETMESALARTYRENPQLNAQRAQVRGTDENIPQALSGYRPKIGVTATLGEQTSNLLEVSPVSGQGNVFTRIVGPQTPTTYGVTAQQILFNGLQTANRTRTAESQVRAAREGLRVIEQNVLVAAATIYMDVLRDTAAVQIQKSNVEALKSVVDQTNKRFGRGDVTVTDVEQAKAQLAAGESALLAAEANLATSTANYQAIIGVPPKNLRPATPVDRHVAGTLAAAVQVAATQNPNVTAAMYGIDVAYLQVKINEGALFPTLAFLGSVQQSNQPVAAVANQFVASAGGQLNNPIYQGGGE
jgi:outer membrane protein